MAESITRLRVESTEYDNKIKRATQGLLDMERACRKVDGTLAVLEQGEKDFVRSLGSMETASRDARGQINELTKAYTELSLQYKRLTDEEKRGDYGKALNQSLSQLRDRIKDAKGGIQDVTGSLGNKGLSGVLDAVTSKLGISRAAFTSAGASIAAITAAVKVAKDAFLASEKNIDDWGRTVSSAKAVYEGFLTAINTGDISGYLSRIGQISQAARQAYTEMDALGTLRTVNSVPYQEQMTLNEKYRGMLRTRRNLDTGEFLTDEQIRDTETKLEEGIRKLGNLVQAEINQADKAIAALYNKQAQQLGLTPEEFKAGTSSYAELQKGLAGAAKYREWQDENGEGWVAKDPSLPMSNSNRVFRKQTSANPYEAYKAWSVFKDDGELFQTIVQTIQQREALQMRFYQLLTQAYTSINRAEGITARKDPLAGRESLGSLGLTGVNASNPFDAAARLRATGQEISSLRVPVGSVQIEEDKQREEQKALKDAMTKMSQATSGLSSIMSGLQQVGIEIPDEAKQVVSTIQGLMSIIQGVISVIQAFSTVSQSANTTAVGTLTAAVIANTAAVNTNSVVGAIPGLAHGGIVKAATGVVVPGTSWSNDQVPALLNSGELVLNKAQQGNLASQLRGVKSQQSTGQPYVSGELVFLAINNYLQRSGRGEIVTSR